VSLVKLESRATAKECGREACSPGTVATSSSERQGRVRAYHGREEPRAQPAASRRKPTFERTRVAFGCCNGRLDGAQGAPTPLAPVVMVAFGVSGFDTVGSSARRGVPPFKTAATANAEPGTSQTITV
jgi:hypothetical protein